VKVLLRGFVTLAHPQMSSTEASQRLRGSVSLVRVHDDAAEEIAGADADIAKDHWQTLEVVADGDGFTISLDDRWVLTAFDRHAVQKGKIALWTEKSDVTQFDQVEMSPAGVVTN
jgi:hypothetical protein